MKQLLILLMSIFVLSCNSNVKDQTSHRFPDSFMNEYLFLLGSVEYATYTAFEDEARPVFEASGVDIGETAFDYPRIKIEYFYSLDGRTVHEENFLLDADNGKSFTAGELLFEINSQTFENLREEDHKSFEGLEYTGMDGDIPEYRIAQGS